MTKSYVYSYLTTDGSTLQTSVQLAGIEGVRLVRLIAGKDKMLTNGKVTCPAIVVPENAVDSWREVAKKG